MWVPFMMLLLAALEAICTAVLLTAPMGCVIFNAANVLSMKTNSNVPTPIATVTINT